MSALDGQLTAVAISDGSGDRERLLAWGRAVLEGGVGCVHLREPRLPAADLLDVASTLRSEARLCGAIVVVNDRVDVAAFVDGVHLGQRSLPVVAARKLSPVGHVVGVSVHSAAELRVAVEAGVDYVFVSPVFRTESKPGVTPLGIEAAAELTAASFGRAVWLGGITAARLDRLVLPPGAARPRGFAGIGAFADCDPAASQRFVDAARAIIAAP